jgi:hypothetical protein
MIELPPITNSNQDLTSSGGVLVGEITQSDPTGVQLAGTVLLTGLDPAAAMFSVRVELLDDAATPVFCGGMQWTEHKPDEAETVAAIALPREACFVPADGSIRVRIESSNPADTAVDVVTLWREDQGMTASQQVCLAAINAAMANIDSTDHETLPLAKAIECIFAYVFNTASRTAPGEPWSYTGRDGATDILTAHALPTDTARTGATVE